MPGATIDHIIAVTLLVAALTLSFSVFDHTFGTAVMYQRNRGTVMKAVDLIDMVCLSSGTPVDWGQSNSTPLSFGLQNPTSSGYTLSPFSVMRLRTSEDNQLVYYPITGVYYNNLSLGFGGSLLMPVGDCVNYTVTTELLGVNGSYGFQLNIMPTLNIQISQIPASHLILRVDVRGPGLSLSGANLNFHMLHVVPGGGNEPSIVTQSGVVQTDLTGSASIEFPSIDDSDDAYSFMVIASLSGLMGMSYYSHDVLGDYPPFIVPLIENFEEGTITLAHSWDVHEYGSPVPNVFYNATFFVLTEDLSLTHIQIVNATGHINYGKGGFSYTTTEVPASTTGILFISYRWGDLLGSVVVPWGISSLGVSVTFGGDPSTYDFVATEIRQVTLDKMSYQVKVALWRLG